MCALRCNALNRVLQVSRPRASVSTHSRPLASLVPHELLATPPMPPPSHTLDHVSGSVAKLHSAFSLHIASQDQTTLATVVQKFSRDLRLRHRSPISWPLEKAQQDIHAYHRDTLVSPVLHMFSQLRARTIKKVLQCTVHIPHPGVSVVLVTSVYSTKLDVPADDSATPTLIFLPIGALRDFTSDSMHSALPEQLLRTWQSKPPAKIVCTDLESAIILHPPLFQKHSNAVVYERHSLNGNLAVLRILLAAYIYDSLPFNSYLAFSQTGPAIWDPPSLRGCPINPATPLLSDEQVFATHRRHSDLYTLMQDRKRALQFFRWKERVAANPSRPASVGDTVSAITQGFSQRYTALKPYFPIGTIPSNTLNHIQSVQRLNPLDEDATSRLVASEVFTLDILEDLNQEPSTVFRCRIHSIDGKDMASSPDLCVKFFDDRLFPMDPPDSIVIGIDTRLWRRWASSEDCVRNEDATYKRLSVAQGSLVPFYYGAHFFTLPNGDQLFGLLMEYVQAPPLRRSNAGSLTEDQRAEFVRSVRHALRLLDRADVSQHDWHAYQLLLLRSPSHIHCVLIDFARASISVALENHAEDDYGDVLRNLVDPEIGLGEQVVFRNFGEREVWDSVKSSVWDNGKLRWTQSKDPFSFVYEQPMKDLCRRGIAEGSLQRVSNNLHTTTTTSSILTWKVD